MIFIHHFQLETITAKKTLSLTQEQLARFEQLCECRAARMPIQYIIGEWDFCDLVLKMIPPVFIPRPETEELVELILQQFDSKLSMRFMEIGCGSGAISLALLHALPKVCENVITGLIGRVEAVFFFLCRPNVLPSIKVNWHVN